MAFDFKKMIADKKAKKSKKKGLETGPSDKAKLFGKDKKDANS